MPGTTESTLKSLAGPRSIIRKTLLSSATGLWPRQFWALRKPDTAKRFSHGMPRPSESVSRYLSNNLKSAPSGRARVRRASARLHISTASWESSPKNKSTAKRGISSRPAARWDRVFCPSLWPPSQPSHLSKPATDPRPGNGGARVMSDVRCVSVLGIVAVLAMVNDGICRWKRC